MWQPNFGVLAPAPEREPAPEPERLCAAALWQHRDQEAARLSEIIGQASADPPALPLPPPPPPPILAEQPEAAPPPVNWLSDEGEDAERARLRALINGEAPPEPKRQCVAVPKSQLNPAGLLSEEGGLRGFLESVRNSQA